MLWGKLNENENIQLVGEIGASVNSQWVHGSRPMRATSQGFMMVTGGCYDRHEST